MPERHTLKILILGLLILPMVAGQSMEVEGERPDPALGARVISNTVLDVRALESIPRSNQVDQVDPDRCQADGTIRVIDDHTFRFSEESNEAACSYVFLPVFLPSSLESMTVRFDANRVLKSTVEAQPFTPGFRQELRVLDEGNNILDRVDIFDSTAGDNSESQSFSFLVRFPIDAGTVRLAWYFEDTQTSAGSPTTPAWISEVRDPRVAFAPFDVPTSTVQLEDILRTEDDLEVVEHRATTNVTLSTNDLQAATNTLELDVLGAYDLESVTLPGGHSRNASELQATIVGGTTTYTLPDDMVVNPGVYSFHLLATSSSPIIESPPVTIYPLAWAGIILPVAFAVAAGVHHEVFRRHKVESQTGDWARMLVTFTLLTVAYIAFVILWFLVDGLALMGTLPVVANGILFWAGITTAIILFSVHWGVGAMRRRHARRIRHEEQLEQRNLLLERSNKELEQFAFMAAHDLQEPLRKVVSYTTLLQHRYKDKLGKKADGYIDEASRQADRMRRLISDVLAFSRIDKDLEMQDVDLDLMFAELQQDVPDELRSTGVTFSGKDLGAVRGNRAMLRQLLENLIGNGIKYQRDGVTPHITVTTHDLGHAVQVEVTDNGIGIEPEYQGRVFDLFERLHGAESTYKGTGIGLAICKKIVEAHDGEIGVRSTPGEGSTFFFTIPHGGNQ